jgi:predicted nucleic acid-binding protein
VARIIMLDSGPLWTAIQPRGASETVDRFHMRLLHHQLNGTIIALPEVIVYEVRRKRILQRATAQLRRLDAMCSDRARFTYVPINTEAMTLAADLWADARRIGRPLSSRRQGRLPKTPREDIDIDVILAAQALGFVGERDKLTVATGNVRHLDLFVDARDWDEITA